MGADVSLATFMQQQGVVFRDGSVAKPPERILYDRGANLFRLRLFVSPQTTYTNTNFGAIQDLNYTIALAQQLKANAPGAKLLLDFHYSDTWADPGRQTTPAAWSGQTVAQLEATIRSYTRTSLTAFKNAGVMPELVQVGNEIQSGMLWDAGKINFSGTTAQQRASWQNFGRLVNAAIAGVRDAQATSPKVQVAIHPGQSNVSEFFFSRLSDPNYANVATGNYEIMGVSYYPSADQLGTLQADLNTLINTYNKKVMVLETNAPWRSQFAPASDPTYTDTAQGQADFLADLRDMVLTLPGGNGMGVLWWYPEAVQVPGYNIYNGGSTALFDNNRAALPAVDALQPSLVWLGGSGDWSQSAKWNLNLVPNTASLHARIDDLNPAASTVTLDQDVAVARLTLGVGDTLVIPNGRRLTLSGPQASLINGVVSTAGIVSVPVVSISGAGAALHYLGGSLDIGELHLKGGASLLMSAGGNKTLKVASLFVDVTNGSNLDLADNKLITANAAGTATAGIYNGLQGEVQRGYNFGSWDGAGLTTSMLDALRGITTIGVATGEQIRGLGPTDTDVWAGQTINGASTIAMYTYAGDANLDGQVDAGDYGILDAFIQVEGATGYGNGDFNYDGFIDPADYGTIDNSIQFQGPPFPTVAAVAGPGTGLSATAAVPEPTAFSLIGLPAAALMRRRRRRHASRAMTEPAD